MFDIHNYGATVNHNEKKKQFGSFQDARTNFLITINTLVSENLPLINKEGEDLNNKKDERSQIAFDKKLTAWKDLVVSVETLARMYNINKQ